jgi:hypothetical protein
LLNTESSREVLLTSGQTRLLVGKCGLHSSLLISESGLQPLLCAQLLNAESSLKVLLSRSLSSLLISQRRLEAHLAPSNTRLLVSQRSLHTLLCAKPLCLECGLQIGLTGSKPSRLIEPLSL